MNELENPEKKNKTVLAQRIDTTLYEEVKKYADANAGGNLKDATERLLRLGLESLNKKPTVAELPKCPSCGEPLSAPYLVCKKEGKIVRELASSINP